MQQSNELHDMLSRFSKFKRRQILFPGEMMVNVYVKPSIRKVFGLSPGHKIKTSSFL
jgi:hypothetical protein